MTRVSSVVLPAPLHPARPMMRIGAGSDNDRDIGSDIGFGGTIAAMITKALAFATLSHGAKNHRSARPQMPAPGVAHAQGACRHAGGRRDGRRLHRIHKR